MNNDLLYKMSETSESQEPPFEYEDITYKITKKEIKIYNDFKKDILKLKLKLNLDDDINPKITLLIKNGIKINDQFLDNPDWMKYDSFINIWKKYLTEMLNCFYDNPEEYYHLIDFSFDTIVNSGYDFDFDENDDPEPEDNKVIKITECKYDFIEHFLEIAKNDPSFSERKRNQWNITKYRKKYKKFLECKKIYDSKILKH